MQKQIIFFIMLIVLFGLGQVFAQYNNDNQSSESSAPSGMESRKVNNGVTVLMPKGGRMHKTNEITYVEESSDEYAARNFASVESRLDKLEKDNRELREEINNIRASLSSAEKNANKNAADINKE